ncbi:hypothetical protein J3A83DRAFT_4194562 [Scleroderma citrinum]
MANGLSICVIVAGAMGWPQSGAMMETEDMGLSEVARILEVSGNPGGQPLNTKVKYHAHSGYTYGCKPNTFKQMDDGPFKQEQESNMYHSFWSQAEWSLAKFLMDNFMQAQINWFLALPWFCDNLRPSFTSAEELLGWVDTLPSGVKWQSTVLEVEGYPTSNPICLFWHDGVEVIASLFGDPIFGPNMMFDPVAVTTHLG